MPDPDWNLSLPLHFGEAETPQMSLSGAVAGDPQRALFEAFIQQRFRKAHGADIRQFMPELFGVQNSSGQLCAVAGVRRAHLESLFLERYLDDPIEPLISATAERPVPRQDIVEVGNLAASDTGSARLSIIAITYLLAMGRPGMGDVYRQHRSGQQLSSPGPEAGHAVRRRPGAPW